MNGCKDLKMNVQCISCQEISEGTELVACFWRQTCKHFKFSIIITIITIKIITLIIIIINNGLILVT